MDCIVLQENLKQALAIVSRVISTKNELPVLSHVLIEAKEGKIYLSGTNLEMGVKVTIGGKVEKEGAVTVPARLLAEFIGTLASEKIYLTLKDNSLVVKTQRAQATFSTIPASEFPPFPQKGDDQFSFLAADIMRIANEVAFSASADDGRPVLNGIQLKSSDGALVTAATDGFRLSICRFKSSKDAFPDSIVPARTLEEIAKLCGEKKAESVTINLAKNTNQIIIKLPDTEVFSRLLEGEFPNYQRIVPSHSTTQATFDRLMMLQATRAAAIFAREAANIIRLKISKNSITVSANTPQIGEEKSEVEASVEGEVNEIAFNFRFLLDFLTSVSEEVVILEMTTPLSPVLLRGAKDSSFTHVIMPVRVQGEAET